MFESKPKPGQKQGQNTTAPHGTLGSAAPKSIPLLPVQQRPPPPWMKGDAAEPASKPSSSLQHAVYRPPAAPAPAPKPSAGDPVRTQIGMFGDKATRQALYSAYAVIRAVQDVNPKQALEVMRVFRQQTLKDKTLTAQEAQGLARELYVRFSAQVGSASAVMDGGNPNVTNAQYQKRMLTQYNAYTGNLKNTTVPGVGAFFDPKTPPLSPAQQVLFGSMAGAGPGLAGIGGKFAAGVVGSVFGKNNVRPPQTTTNTARTSVPLPQRGTPARPVSQTGTRAQYEQAQQQARLARYRYDPKLRKDAQLLLDLKPTPRTGETAQQAQQRVQAAQREIQVRKLVDGFGSRAWRPNIVANDAKNVSRGAHTLDRHSWNLTNQDLKDRVMGTGRWPRAESYSYKWVSEEVANREVQKYIRENWNSIRRSLAESGEFRTSWDTGRKVGEGFYNKNLTLGGPRVPVRGETSWAFIAIKLDPSGNLFIVTTYPKGGF